MKSKMNKSLKMTEIYRDKTDRKAFIKDKVNLVHGKLKLKPEDIVEVTTELYTGEKERNYFEKPKKDMTVTSVKGDKYSQLTVDQLSDLRHQLKANPVQGNIEKDVIDLTFETGTETVQDEESEDEVFRRPIHHKRIKRNKPQ